MQSRTYKPRAPRPGSDLVHSGHQMLKDKPKPNKEWERQQATKVVVRNVSDETEREMFLDMLGLSVPDGQDASSMRSVVRKKGKERSES